MLTVMTVLLALAQAAPEGKEETKAALEAWKTGIHQSNEPDRVAAVEALAKHVSPEAIAALGSHLMAEDTDRVKSAIAKALGGMDHPKSLEVLIAALPANESSKTLFDAVVKALQKLDWEGGAEPLNSLLGKYHEK